RDGGPPRQGRPLPGRPRNQGGDDGPMHRPGLLPGGLPPFHQGKKGSVSRGARSAVALLTALALLGGCSKKAAAEKLVLTGSSTIAPLVSEMGKRFETLHPGVHVDVQSGGSGRGVTDSRQGLADIGLVSRVLKDDEKDLVPYT